ncbi:calcium-binding protein [Ruegeria pomeroyi]|uniref:Calcium-binding protein n=2 Tax=Ruegeria pomeroyi TaxID=89184 RepID=A0A9Q3WLM5_9RHOB|nr:calcium-binding protein [Ruegeria pomeroyi]
MIGSRGMDIFWGDAGDDILIGGHGKDKLAGGDGDDKLFGGRGKDMLAGGKGDDFIAGGRGKDVIDGGEGDDLMLGGAGADTFRFSTGKDVARDFGARGQADQIDLGKANGIADFDDLKANHLTEVDGDAVITDAAGNSLTLCGVQMDMLDAQDFLF